MNKIWAREDFYRPGKSMWGEWSERPGLVRVTHFSCLHWQEGLESLSVPRSGKWLCLGATSAEILFTWCFIVLTYRWWFLLLVEKDSCCCGGPQGPLFIIARKPSPQSSDLPRSAPALGLRVSVHLSAAQLSRLWERFQLHRDSGDWLIWKCAESHHGQETYGYYSLIKGN